MTEGEKDLRLAGCLQSSVCGMDGGGDASPSYSCRHRSGMLFAILCAEDHERRCTVRWQPREMMGPRDGIPLVVARGYLARGEGITSTVFLLHHTMWRLHLQILALPFRHWPHRLHRWCCCCCGYNVRLKTQEIPSQQQQQQQRRLRAKMYISGAPIPLWRLLLLPLDEEMDDRWWW